MHGIDTFLCLDPLLLGHGTERHIQLRPVPDEQARRFTVTTDQGFSQLRRDRLERIVIHNYLHCVCIDSKESFGWCDICA